MRSPPVVVPVRAGRFPPAPLPPLWPYTIWGQGTPSPVTAGAQAPFTLATQFTLTRPCTLGGIWWYSYASATALPSVCGVWDVGTQAAVTEDFAPSWTAGGGVAVAGAGWVFCDFSGAGVGLEAGPQYAVAVFQPAAGVPWWCTEAGYWTVGPGRAGITSGPIFAPESGVSVNGQGCYDASGAWAFPGGNPGNGDVFFADVQVCG